jgi:signal-transduction protein with cAMP-binding, CBS, and nucleotidyltransferase domain
LRTLDALLSDHPFFKGLDPQKLQFLAGCASDVRFEEGEFLYREGDEANNFFVIREGKVAIEAFSPKRGALTIVLTTYICHGSIRLQDTDNGFPDADAHNSSNE